MFNFLPLVGKRSGRVVLGTILCLAISAMALSTPCLADDASKPDAAKVEASKVDTPKIEAPKVDTPKADTPKADVPKTDPPETDTKKADAKKSEDEKADAKEKSQTATLENQIKPPSVTDGDFLPPQSERVTVLFKVHSKGSKKNLRVVVYYGEKDGGEEPSQWDKNTGPLAPDPMKKDEDAYTVVLPDLKPETNYCYRVRAENSAGTKWSDAAVFETAPSGLPWHISLGIGIGILAAFILPFWVGGWIAKTVRMPEQGWRIGVILCSLTFAIIIIGFSNGPQLGIDLSGGVIMVYEIDEDATAKAHDQGEKGEEAKEGEEPAKPEKMDKKARMDKMITALGMRINPGGEKTIVIRQRGPNQIEITIPRADEQQVKRIQKRIVEAGTLAFRILASRESSKPEHQELIDLALAREKEGGIPPSEIRNENGDLLGWWNPVNLKREDEFDFMRERNEIVTRVANIHGIPRLEVLLVNDPYGVTGDYLSHCRTGPDNSGRPAVHFNFNSQGANLFGELTEENKPVEGAQEYRYHLGIVLNGDLYSAPYINDRITSSGIISGDFDDEKAQDLVNVLNAGSLPAVLKKNPVSEWNIGPTLGRDTVRSGKIAITISVILVLVFMAIYYGFAGLVACGALLMNMILLFGIMIGIHADFTLPGIAGLVLTVGMAVDANVLIFERIREELDRGAALRMAIRNGFAKATTTIVDANVTTLITAIVLFVVGTPQIRGFAVTLFLGITLSMFTAIFCARVVFDIAERRRMITKLSMMRILGKTNIDFVQKQIYGVVFSGILIVIGLIAIIDRGKGVLDIDFTGGESVTVVFKDKHTTKEVREALGKKLKLQDLTVSDATPTGQGVEEGTWYVINTSTKPPKGEDVSATQYIEDELFKSYGDALKTYTLESYGKTPLDAEGQPLLPESVPEAKEPETGEKSEEDEPSSTSSTGSTFLADDNTKSADETMTADKKDPTPTSTEPGDKPVEDKQPETKEAANDPTKKDEKKASDGKETASAKDGSPYSYGTEIPLVFGQTLDHETLEGMIKEALKVSGTPKTAFELTNEKYVPEDTQGYEKWTLRIALPMDQVDGKVIEPLRQILHQRPIFPASSSIGSQVASDYKVSGIVAILASLICIVAYIWIRFQRVVFGLAAVVALIHDVLVTLGILALSAYLAPYLGILGIEGFKISLVVLAAFLTIIGYSLNDTIVVFDRIREVRGKAPNITGSMINTSINQTLSRTLLTSLTTFIVVLILYILGGSGIHAFAFTLIVGVIVGTYSSIFIASPVLLWLSRGDTSTKKK